MAGEVPEAAVGKAEAAEAVEAAGVEAVLKFEIRLGDALVG
jgi:hypothetical protein